MDQHRRRLSYRSAFVCCRCATDPLEAGRAAVTKHDAAVKRAEIAYKKALTEADRQEVADLNVALRHAMDSKDLNEANALNAEKNAAMDREQGERSHEEKDETARLQPILNGTTWQWGNDSIKFMGDGTVWNTGWNSRGLVTEWTVIDRRTVLLSIARGRDHDYYAILVFSPKADAYAGFSFDGSSLPVNHQLRR